MTTPNHSPLRAHAAWELITRTPAHALHKLHAEVPASPAMRLGKLVHLMLLGPNPHETGSQDLITVDAPDWRSKAARELRETIEAAGNVAVLPHEYAQANEMALATHPFLPDFAAVETEQRLTWTVDTDYGEVACSGTLDMLAHDRSLIVDVKTTNDAESWERRHLWYGPAFQAAWYRSGVRALFGCEPQLRFVVVESAPPYGALAINLGFDAVHLGDTWVSRAVNAWARCCATGEWPAYTEARTAYVPAWLDRSEAALAASEFDD